jgi:hypothetical protein
VKLAAILAAALVALTTVQHPTTIKAGTRIACLLVTAVDSTKAQSGDVFKLKVEDPAHPYLDGAVIEGHVTRVWQARGLQRAEIAFLFDDITFVNNTKTPIRAYVVSENVVQRTTHTPQPAMPNQAAMAVKGPSPSTIVWSTTLGPKPAQTSQTGGYAYASRGGVPLVVSAGSAVTIQLASDLTTP